MAKRGDINTKLQILKELRLGCIDIIKEVDTDDSNASNISSNGFPDSALFSGKSKRTYYVDDIIVWIDQHPELENVIASWGKGSPMNTEVRDQIKSLNDHLKSRGIKSDLFSLSPFGRGVSYENLSIELEPFILNS